MYVRFALLSLAFCLLTATSFGSDDQPLRINAEDARQHAGKKVEVIFEVKATKNSAKRKTVFLDSEADFNDRKNLGIAISEEGVADLKKVRDVTAPEEHYRGKKIRVVGEVVIEDDRAYIKVNHAEQLDLAKDKS